MPVPDQLKTPVTVALSIVALLALVVGMVSLDAWMFRDPGLVVAGDGAIAGDQMLTQRTYEAYRQWTYGERQRAFSWQARSTKVIFWVSILVAVSGIGLAFWQFVNASKEAARAADENELEIKSQLISLAFKSRSIAALVLFMSIAYLLIYTLLIYPIKDATGGAGGANLVPLQEPQAVPVAEPRVVLDEAVRRLATNPPPPER